MKPSMISTTGIILREQKIRENDRLVTVLTRDRGIVRAFVSGALKLGSKNLSSTQLLCYSELKLSAGREDTYRITESKPVELFFGLRSDIEALGLAGYLCELCIALAPQDDDAAEYLRLMLNTLYYLSQDGHSCDMLKAVFELKICQMSGYCPDIELCAKCGGEIAGGAVFDPVGGVAYCEGCGRGTRISPSVYAAMKHILYAPDNRVFAFRVGEETAFQLSEVCSSFVRMQTESKFKTLDFYNSVRGM